MDELLEALCVEEWQADIDPDRKFDAVDIIQMCQSLVVYEESN